MQCLWTASSQALGVLYVSHTHKDPLVLSPSRTLNAVNLLVRRFCFPQCRPSFQRPATLFCCCNIHATHPEYYVKAEYEVLDAAADFRSFVMFP